MIQINIGDHVSTEAGFVQYPNRRLATIQWARRHSFWIAANVRTANPYYRGLPGGRSLKELLDDNSIWINYHATAPELGITNFAGGKEIAIAETSFRRGRWMVLASLVHELAHVNGVRGRLTPQAAELAVLACGMGRRSEFTSSVDDPSTPYDPTISG
jgi:hypothetical protein